MNVQTIFAADPACKVTYGFHKTKALVVAHGSANFDNMNVRAIRCLGNGIFNSTCKVRNKLYGLSVKFTSTLIGNKVAEQAPRERRVLLRELNIEKAFVVTKVEVGFGAVFGNETLTVFARIQKTRIYVKIRVAFLNRDSCPLGLQDSTNARSGNTLTDA